MARNHMAFRILALSIGELAANYPATPESSDPLADLPCQGVRNKLPRKRHWSKDSQHDLSREAFNHSGYSVPRR